MAEPNEEATPPEPAHPHTAHAILQDPDFKALAQRKNAISLVLTVIVFTFYFGYMGLLATNSPIVNKPAVGAATLGIPMGIGVIIAAWILTGIYVTWANNTYDSMVATIKKKMQ